MGHALVRFECALSLSLSLSLSGACMCVCVCFLLLPLCVGHRLIDLVGERFELTRFVEADHLVWKNSTGNVHMRRTTPTITTATDWKWNKVNTKTGCMLVTIDWFSHLAKLVDGSMILNEVKRGLFQNNSPCKLFCLVVQNIYTYTQMDRMSNE